MSKRVAVITAGAAGIGYACAKKLAEQGVIVHALDRNCEAGKNKLAGESIDIQENVEFHHFDAFEKESYESIIREIGEKHKHIDYLVNNFGYTDPRKDFDIRNIDTDFYVNTVSANIDSVVRMTKNVMPYMIKNGGSIVNIASVAATVPDITQLAYGTAKAAIVHITKMTAVSEARNGIRCNAILPGITLTDAVKNAFGEKNMNHFLRHVPMRRCAEPEEIGASVAYLMSDEAKYITGQYIEVSGGFGLGTPLYADVFQ